MSSQHFHELLLLRCFLSFVRPPGRGLLTSIAQKVIKADKAGQLTSAVSELLLQVITLWPLFIELSERVGALQRFARAFTLLAELPHEVTHHYFHLSVVILLVLFFDLGAVGRKIHVIRTLLLLFLRSSFDVFDGTSNRSVEVIDPFVLHVSL